MKPVWSFCCVFWLIPYKILVQMMMNYQYKVYLESKIIPFGLRFQVNTAKLNSLKTGSITQYWPSVFGTFWKAHGLTVLIYICISHATLLADQ